MGVGTSKSGSVSQSSASSLGASLTDCPAVAFHILVTAEEDKLLAQRGHTAQPLVRPQSPLGPDQRPGS